MPEIDNENHSKTAAIVPDLVIEGIVNNDNLAFLPCPDNKQRQTDWLVHKYIADWLAHMCS